MGTPIVDFKPPEVSVSRVAFEDEDDDTIWSRRRWSTSRAPRSPSRTWASTTQTWGAPCLAAP